MRQNGNRVRLQKRRKMFLMQQREREGEEDSRYLCV